MRSYKEFLNEIKSPKIYVDMDGVLVDFDKAAAAAIAPAEYNQKNIDVLLSDPKRESKEFWQDMPPLSDGLKLWRFVKQMDVNILSASPDISKNKRNSVIGKGNWLKQHLGFGDKRRIHIVPNASSKTAFANGNSILIDDRGKNIRQWIAAGGIGIKYLNSTDAIKQLKAFV